MNNHRNVGHVLKLVIWINKLLIWINSINTPTPYASTLHTDSPPELLLQWAMLCAYRQTCYRPIGLGAHSLHYTLRKTCALRCGRGLAAAADEALVAISQGKCWCSCGKLR